MRHTNFYYQWFFPNGEGGFSYGDEIRQDPDPLKGWLRPENLQEICVFVGHNTVLDHWTIYTTLEEYQEAARAAGYD